jgi:patatin-like phospholipase/acyl hydrolase
MARRYRILSIDGGGIRGIIPAVVLAELERRSERRIFELFDMFAGTSTGGILTLALAAPQDGGSARWPARDLVDLYLENGPVIFERSLWRSIRALGGILDEKYTAAGLESVLRRYFGETKLSQALVEVLVTAYDLEGRDPFFFKRRKALAVPEDDYPMWEVARATSSAPTYFEPFQLRTPAVAGYYALVDGGVFATNPAMCAYADARRFEADAEIVLVSLGTGQLERPIRYEEAKDWGMLEWARPILDVVFDGVADTTDYELRQLVDESCYFRLQTSLDFGSDALDDASRTNMRALLLKAEDLVQQADNDGFFSEILPLLAGNE